MENNTETAVENFLATMSKKEKLSLLQRLPEETLDYFFKLYVSEILEGKL